MGSIGYPDIAQFERENGSVPFELSGFIRREAVKKHSAQEWNALVERVRSHPEQFAEYAEPELLQAATASRQRIRAQFAESNARLERDFGHLYVTDPG